MEVELRIGARVMLIYNVNTTDGLTNGAVGVVNAIEKKDNGKDLVIVEFDEPDAGEEERKKYPRICQQYGNHVTAVGRVSFEYAVGNPRKGVGGNHWTL